MGFFRNLFSGEPSSAALAKQRLQVVLVQDHIPMPPGTMEAIKAEIMEVISRHLEIEPEGVEVAVERRGHNDEVVANIPCAATTAALATARRSPSRGPRRRLSPRGS